jgi:hypothetical protein
MTEEKQDSHKRVQDAPPVAALTTELEQYQTMLPGMRARVEAAERALADAQQVADLAAITVLAGRDANLVAAQARLADATRELALARTDFRDKVLVAQAAQDKLAAGTVADADEASHYLGCQGIRRAWATPRPGDSGGCGDGSAH